MPTRPRQRRDACTGVRHRMFETPTGAFYVVLDADGMIEAGWRDMLRDFGGTGRTHDSLGEEVPGLLPDLCARIILAMDGRRVDFDDVPTPSGTGFQRTVWNVTRLIGPGSTATYGELAARIGRPGAARAVGQAMRRNRLPMVIPCHRIIGAGDSGGFGGERAGTSRWTTIKTALLAAERDGRAQKSSG